MKNFYTEEQWNEILKQQESVLCYDTFTRKQALELGLLIAEVTEKKYHGSVAVRIVEDETTVFAYKMEGATLEADWWMTNRAGSIAAHGDELAAGADDIESRRTGSILESARGELLRVRRLHSGFHERWKPSFCLCDGIRHGTLGRSSGDRGCDGETAGS